MMVRVLVLVVLGSLIGFSDRSAHAEDSYPLDGIERTVSPKGKMKCPTIARITRRGDAVKWATPIEVNADFDKRLAKFEDVVGEIAKKVLGRAPTKITHFGTYNCRRIRRYPDLLSEHGLANAVDVAGFVFPALSKDAQKTSSLPKRLQRALTVTVLEHWTDEGPKGQFLRALTAELERRADIFRVMLGPAYPGHKNHFHFDMAPYRLVQL